MRLFVTILFVFILSQNTIWGQDSRMTNESFQFLITRSHHSTNDMPGFMVGSIYQKTFSQKWGMQIGIEGTLNDQEEYPLVFEYEGETFDSTTHSVTGGIQLVFGVGYNIINTQKSVFSIDGLPLLRYQATSISNIISVEFPAATGLPYPVRLILNETPYRTFAVGGSLRFNYKYIIQNRWSLGTQIGFQADTNGDNIFFYGITLGKVF